MKNSMHGNTEPLKAIEHIQSHQKLVRVRISPFHHLIEFHNVTYLVEMMTGEERDTLEAALQEVINQFCEVHHVGHV